MNDGFYECDVSTGGGAGEDDGECEHVEDDCAGEDDGSMENDSAGEEDSTCSNEVDGAGKEDGAFEIEDDGGNEDGCAVENSQAKDLHLSVTTDEREGKYEDVDEEEDELKTVVNLR